MEEIFFTPLIFIGVKALNKYLNYFLHEHTQVPNTTQEQSKNII